MPAPGESAALLHRQGTAQCEAILPRGMHLAHCPQLQQGQEPRVAGTGGGEGGQAVRALETWD